MLPNAEDKKPIPYQALLEENHALKDEIKSLRARLEEAEELERAISEGDLDALVIPGPKGELIFTLDSADHAYRVLVETMNEGTATFTFDGTILYCNRRFAEFLSMQQQDIIGKSIYLFIAPENKDDFNLIMDNKIKKGEINLKTKDNKYLPVYVSINSLKEENSPNVWCLVITDLTDITEHMKNEEALQKAYEEIQTQNEELQAQSEEIIVQNDELRAQSEKLNEVNEALRESEERFHTMANAIPQLAWIARADGYIYWYNDRWYAYTGTTPEQMEGWGWQSVHDPAVLPKVLEQWRASIATGKPFDMEFPLRGTDGIFRPFLTRVLPLKDAKGRVLQWFGTNTDITERKQEEHRIRRYNRILNGINRIFNDVVQAKTEEELGNTILSVALDVTGDGIGFVNLLGDDGLMHDIAISEMGWNQCLMYDKTGHRRPPGNFVVHGLYGHVVTSGKGFFTNNPPSHPESIGLPPGHPPLTSFLGVPLVQNGKVVGMLGVANREGGYSCEQLEDLEAIAPAVTQALKRKREEQERKQLEEQIRQRAEELELVMDVAPVAIWIGHDPQSHYITGNRMANEFYEAEVGENVSANVTPLRRFFYKGRELTADELPMQQASLKDTDIRNSEFDVLLPSGEWRTLLGSASPLQDAEGYVRGSVGTFIDITDRKKAEESLKKQAALIDLSPDAIITRQLDGTINFWNKGAQSLYGWTSQEAIGQITHTLLKTRFPQPFEQIFKQVQQTGYWSGELIHCTKDGRQVIVQSRWQAEFDDQGNVIDMLESNVDITERKKAEEELRKSENRFRVMFEGHGAPMLLIEPDSGQIIDANEAAARFYEYSREQLRAMYIDQINQLPPEEVAAERYNAVERSKNVFVFTHRLASGDERLVEVYSSPVTIQGRPMLFSIIHDITLRKKAEEALHIANETLEAKVKERTAELEKAYNLLKESEKSLAEAQKIAHIGSWEWNIATDKARWSDELYHIFELKPQEFRPSYNEFLNYVHPEDRDYVSKAFKNAINGKTYSIDHRIVLANGKERTVHTQSEVVFDERNIPVRIRGTVQDITERKKAEEKIQDLANIVESSDDAIGTISLDGIITSWNKGAEQIYGYSTEEILGKTISILAQSNLKDETKKLSELVKQGEKIHDYETTRVRKDGKIVYISTTLSPVFDVRGKLTAISLITKDITKRKKAEEALTKIEIARKQEIHHRIKNNLQVISSLLDLQAEKFQDKECIKDSEVLEAFRESQDRVISMALIHEELYKGGEFDTLNFSPYIKELAEKLFQTYSLGNSDISLKLDLAENSFFDMDIAVPLGMIVNELVTNSFKHAFPDKKEGEIEIELHREENEECITNVNEDCTIFVLTVSDNGVGIPDDLDIEDLDTLGMQLVTTLVDQLDGELELNRNNGTAFTIKFTVT